MSIHTLETPLCDYIDILIDYENHVYDNLPRLTFAQRDYFGKIRKYLETTWELSPEAFIDRMGLEREFNEPMIKYWMREKWQDGSPLCEPESLILVYSWYLFIETQKFINPK